VKAPAYALAQEYFDRVDKILAIFAALRCRAGAEHGTGHADDQSYVDELHADGVFMINNHNTWTTVVPPSKTVNLYPTPHPQGAGILGTGVLLT
jgi:hypothetical protein